MGKNLIAMLMLPLLAFATRDMDFDEDWYIANFSTAWTPTNLNPILWYKFDGSLSDSGGAGRDGTLTRGSVVYTNGVNGTAAYSAGDVLVTCPKDFLVTNELTISCWINPGNQGVLYARVINSEAAWSYIVYNGMNRSHFYGSGLDTPFSPSINIPTDQWTHCVVRYKSGENIKLYTNGVHCASITKSGNLSAINEVTMFDRAAGARQYTGAIDDAMIFNRALSDEEIGRIYNWRP